MEILKYVVLGAVIAFTLLFITGQLKMTERYESEDDIQAEIDKLLKELEAQTMEGGGETVMGEDGEEGEDMADEEDEEYEEDEMAGDSYMGMAPGPM
jgi:uncharacterized membrane protein YukC